MPHLLASAASSARLAQALLSTSVDFIEVSTVRNEDVHSATAVILSTSGGPTSAGHFHRGHQSFANTVPITYLRQSGLNQTNGSVACASINGDLNDRPQARCSMPERADPGSRTASLDASRAIPSGSCAPQLKMYTRNTEIALPCFSLRPSMVYTNNIPHTYSPMKQQDLPTSRAHLTRGRVVTGATRACNPRALP